jgi:hypothetical protein
MIKKSLYEEPTIHIDKEELAQLFGTDAGFAVQNAEEEDGAFRFTLSRKTTLDEATTHSQSTPTSRKQAEPRSFL